METFVTSAAHPAVRLNLWNEKLAFVFSGLVADPEEPAHFQGRLAWSSGHAMRCANISATRCRMRHSVAVGAKRDRHLLLILQRSGVLLVEHSKQETILHPGDLILFDAEKSYRLTLLQDSEMIAISLPSALLGKSVASIRSLAGAQLSTSHPDVRLCANFVESLWRLCESGHEEHLSVGAAKALSELLKMCVHKFGDDGQRVQRVDWPVIERYLRDRVFQSGLSVASISAGLGITARRLQQIFAARNTTPCRYILERRLQEVRRRLTDRNLCDVSITEIAFDTGFSDATYFGRAFRARYGASPRAFRRAAQLS